MSIIKNPTTLAVIMACHNRREHTLSCLKALNQQTKISELEVEVYLLDDGSIDGTSEAVSAEFDNVHILKGNGKLYWNRGMYESFSAAINKGFDFYLWLNDDSILYENALEVLLSTYAYLRSQGNEHVIVGSAMQHPDNGKFTYGGIRKRRRAKFGPITLERIAPTDSPIECDALNGNCVLLPADVVDIVGNLDPVYLHVGGDHDYSFRARQLGCTVWLAPGYMGTCKDNSIEGTWNDDKLSIKERIRHLHSPFGYRFYERATYLKRFHGPWWPAQLIWPYIKIVLKSVKL
jgi:GT2 family glycosyltransferase